MDDIWIISWFNHTAFDANPIWKSPIAFGAGDTLAIRGLVWTEQVACRALMLLVSRTHQAKAMVRIQ